MTFTFNKSAKLQIKKRVNAVAYALAIVLCLGSATLMLRSLPERHDSKFSAVEGEVSPKQHRTESCIEDDEGKSQHLV